MSPSMVPFGAVKGSPRGLSNWSRKGLHQQIPSLVGLPYRRRALKTDSDIPGVLMYTESNISHRYFWEIQPEYQILPIKPVAYPISKADSLALLLSIPPAFKCFS